MAIFSLNEVRTEQIKNIANDNFESWPESATYGYFGGGYAPSVPGRVCTIDRIDFSSETTSAPGTGLPQVRNDLAAVSNSSYGYFGGGYGPWPPGITEVLCTIDRLDFSNETISTPGKELTQYRRLLAGTSSNSYGYFASGFVSDRVCTIDRLDFSNETISTPFGAYNGLPQKRNSLAAISSSSHGYFVGGNAGTSPRVCTIERLDFSSETFSEPFGAGNGLSQARYLLAAVSTSSYGYFGGGEQPGSNPKKSTVDRIDFSNETVSTPFGAGNGLPQARDQLTATSSSSHGYFAGGIAPPAVCTIDRLDFSSETFSVPGNHLTQARYSSVGFSGGASYRIKGSRTYGYFGGGFGPGPFVCTIDRLDFSNETTSAPGNGLPQARRYLAATSSNFYGYFAGGSAPPSVCTIHRLDFSNEITSVLGTGLPATNPQLAACSSSSYGYFGGGYTGFRTCTINRLDFSNETISTPGTGLSQARNGFAATQSSSYGYFAGGYADPYVCTIDRIDFSNETVSTPFGAGNGLPLERSNLAAVSSSSYGYFGGGYWPLTNRVDRLDFSNETASDIGDLSQPKDMLAACSSNSYGYFGGGGAPGSICTIDRLDFSNETISDIGDLPQARRGFAAVSN